ncbi:MULTISPECIES: 30S ribosomal protein S20 [unclassified Gemella]|uniref:30S ribosomal protein S20 n=1 Tax=unclassified Gemella TaxID=2624949 RepID=UPI00107406C5|nr:MULTISPECIES: 30S ribosomal protein S20 [unclassified Gemella]MBF0710591.1 30S ribosomal protein S20 [Gemella sp. GL1.1]MBF0746430.1 30S ribosomal protein S20 [Gemella sp. 19428wG2_WT2a]NYS27935.1 30S ribosomal protein S20 [Gemella sp. GL1]TFU60213.1 30S ribosomal protein S20 [Gemella sp. WT2a]
MPNIQSSVKSVRQDSKINAANTAKKSEMRTAIKKAKLAKAEGADNSAELVNFAFKKIDKAAKTNLIHKNAAARYKSSLSK